jgi:hypothetical protein
VSVHVFNPTIHEHGVHAFGKQGIRLAPGALLSLLCGISRTASTAVSAVGGRQALDTGANYTFFNVVIDSMPPREPLVTRSFYMCI